MGRIKPRFVKNVARYLVANYFDLMKNVWDKSIEIQKLTGNLEVAGEFRFNTFKKIVSKLTNIRSKNIRNKVAGAIVRIMRQILILERISLEELRAKYQLKSRERVFEEREEIIGEHEAIAE
ncbi:MAG: hypothetical protein Q6363_005550 [Candidatus Njordarchaeota archaeon]